MIPTLQKNGRNWEVSVGKFLVCSHPKKAQAAQCQRILDQQISAVLAEQQRQRTYAIVLTFFKRDEHKTRLWFRTPNPLLGGLKPDDLIAAGRAETLHRVVMDAIAGIGP